MSIACPKCDGSIILNGPSEVVHCNACQSDIKVPHEYWPEIFTSVLEDIVTEQEENGIVTNSNTFSFFHTRIRYARLNPRCGKCREPLHMQEEAFKTSRQIKCASCGEETTVSPTPDWLKKEFPAALFFVNAIITETDFPKSTITEGVAVTCPRCGGSLIIDGEERLEKCIYCNLHVYLPDELWLRLHPALIKTTWYIVYDSDLVAKMDL